MLGPNLRMKKTREYPPTPGAITNFTILCSQVLIHDFIATYDKAMQTTFIPEGIQSEYFFQNVNDEP